jgi:hypothetical protein
MMFVRAVWVPMVQRLQTLVFGGKLWKENVSAGPLFVLPYQDEQAVCETVVFVA